MADVKPIPEGYHSLTPYLIVDGGAEAIGVLQESIWGDRTVSHGTRRKDRPRRDEDWRFTFHARRCNLEMGYKGPKAMAARRSV